MPASPASARLDHFLAYTDAPAIDQCLQEYRGAGFHVGEQTARHRGELRTGFVRFGWEYLELLWAEDEAQFAAGHPVLPEITRPALRDARRPFGIGLVAPDVHALRAAWAARGVDVPPPFTEVPPGGAPGAPPALTIQPIPAHVLPGVLCFALTYHFPARPRQVPVAPNTAYAVRGVTFVADAPDRRARQWRALLAPARPSAAAAPGSPWGHTPSGGSRPRSSSATSGALAGGAAPLRRARRGARARGTARAGGSVAPPRGPAGAPPWPPRPPSRRSCAGPRRETASSWR